MTFQVGQAKDKATTDIIKHINERGSILTSQIAR